MSTLLKRRKRPLSQHFSASVIAFLIASLPATTAYVVKTLEDIRAAKLAFVNKQIEQLYGPLYAVTQANDAAWHQFCTRIVVRCDGGPVFAGDTAIALNEALQWRSWMQLVFQPFNVRMETVILAHSELVVGTKMPNSFLRLIAHTEGYKTVIARWKESDLKDATFRSASQNVVAGLNYPVEIIKCVAGSYDHLKGRKDFLEASIINGLFVGSEVAPSSCF
jgi:hypothetical protein